MSQVQKSWSSCGVLPDVPRLLAALAVVEKYHHPLVLYGLLDSDTEAPCSCGHTPNAACHFEGDYREWLCRCKPERVVCATCCDLDEGEQVAWPCGEYEAIAAALAGKEKTDD